MVEALTDQKSGNSTPRCSKTVSPVFQLVCTTSRRSQVSSSYGCTPSVLKTRSIFSPASLRRVWHRVDGRSPSRSWKSPSISSSCFGHRQCCWCWSDSVSWCARRGSFPTTPGGLGQPGAAAEAGGSAGSSRVGDGASTGARRRAASRSRPRSRRRTRRRGRRWRSAGRRPRRARAAGRGWPGRPRGPGTSAQPSAAQRVLDGLAEAGQVVLGDRAALAGLPDAGDRLLAGERLGGAGALEHGQLHLLDGGEPLARTCRAGAAAADRAAVVGDPGVEDPGVGVAAVRTVHLGLLPGSIGHADEHPSTGCRGCGYRGFRCVQPAATCGASTPGL